MNISEIWTFRYFIKNARKIKMTKLTVIPLPAIGRYRHQTLNIIVEDETDRENQR